MKKVIAGAFAALLIIAMPASAQSTNDDIDSQATDIVMAAAQFLASRPAFSFSWFVSYDEVEDGQHITYFRNGTTLMVRDEGFVSHTVQDDTVRDYYWDRSVFSIVSPNENFYVRADFSGSFDELVDAVREKTGTVLPMWAILSDKLPEDLMEGVEATAYLGITLIAGQEVHHVIFTEEDQDWQIWISTDEEEPWPLMLVGTHKNEPGSPQFRVYMSDWNSDPDTDPAQFAFEPDENAVRLALPQLSAMKKSNQ